jgi:hypothetical protein
VTKALERFREFMGGVAVRAVLIGLVGWFYFWTAVPEWRPAMIGRTGDGYYNLLMRGFTKGTLSLDTPVDPLLATMSNPSDPAERGEHGLHDASYYGGKYYLYFGAAPVILLFLPFHLLTGEYISETLACPLFAFLGLVASVWLLMAVRKRYFPATSLFAANLCVPALGLANLMPILLRRSNVWEVPITCAYLCLMVGLCFLFKAIHGERKILWLALASAAFGLAVASRPTYLFGCAAVLVPIAAYYLERRDRPPTLADAGFRRLALAGILPLAGIGFLMALYNYERFGSPLDFGFRHLMNGEQVWKEDLFAPRFFAFNVYVYALAPAHWIPYFPFVTVASLPTPPTGHLGSEDPFGVIPNIPFALLAAAALYFATQRRTWPLHLRLFCAAIAIEAAGTGLATSAFGGAINRYEVDFVPSILVLACIGWLALMDGGILRGGWRRLAAAGLPLVLLFSVTFNVLASLGHNGLFRVEHPALYRRIAHRWNALSVKLAQWHGTQYGPLEMDVVFPDEKEEKDEPLVTTGCSFMSDYLLVHYDGLGRTSFALEHSSYGHFMGPLVEIEPGVVHKVKVEMGSLYPPAEHPFFDTLTPVEAELCTRTLRVTVDGNVVLQRDLPFYDAASLQPNVGNSGDLPNYRRKFSGKIVSWQHVPIDLTEPERGPISLKLQFPIFSGARTEPLVSAGERDNGDLLYVRYLSPNEVSFGYDHRGGGAVESSPIGADYEATHTVEFESDALRATGPRATAEKLGRIRLRFDGRTVFYQHLLLSPTRPELVTIGMNRSGSSASTAMFLGQIFETRRLSADEPAGSESRYGPVDMEFRMPAGSTSHLPLVSTGRAGKGDALFIRWSGPGTVRLGYDHWGDGVIESSDIPLTADLPHLMSISLPSLLSPGSTQAARIQAQSLRVDIDGSLAWAQRVSSHPALSTEAYFLSNGIGASSCESSFSKGVAWFQRKSVQHAVFGDKGPVGLQVKLPQGLTNVAEPLLTVGKAGRADVMSIRYADDTHVTFAIDHWGKTFKASGPVAVDYGRVHDLVIQMPNLDPAASDTETKGEALVRLDGNVVWRVSQEFYMSGTPVVIAENPIGASSCTAEFSGGLLKIYRQPPDGNSEADSAPKAANP